MKTDSGVTAYPLQWPEGWPRTRGDLRKHGYEFKQGGAFAFNPDGKKPVTLETARRKLFDELGRMPDVSAMVLSTNVPLRLDGQPRSDWGRLQMPDPGAALYFSRKGKPLVMACDRYNNVASNVRSIGLAIEAMRQLERHGGGVMMDRAFAGFAALPAPGAHHRSWREVLGFAPSQAPTASEIRARYAQLAGERHPDRPGGSHDAMAELNAARDEAMKGLAA